MKFSAKVIGFLFAFLLVFFVSNISFAQSQNTTLPQQKIDSNLETNVPFNTSTWVQTVMIEIMSSMSCQLAGVNQINPNQKCLGVNTNTGKIGYVENSGGVPAVLGKMISILYVPPVQTGDYIRYLSSNFGLSKPTYAQTTGTGYNQLKPLLGLWVQFRNISYLLFVIIFIIVGIAIMLRVKIDPRTVMTVQNQIPKMIIGIVLVTLSYAIAGFMVDLMWVTTYTAVSVISNADPNVKPNGFSSQLNSPTVIFVNDYFKANDGTGGVQNIAGPVAEKLNYVIDDYFSPITPSLKDKTDLPVLGTDPKCLEGVWFWGFGCQIPGAIADVVGGAVNNVVAAAGSLFNFVGGLVVGIIAKIIGFVMFLILIIAIIYSLIKLWFILIKTYISILIAVVFAPFWIIAGLLPGASSLGFSSWIRGLAGNLAAFPAVIALFALGRVFVDSFSSNTTNAFIPPLIGNFNGTNLLSSIIALGIILASPEVVTITKKAFKAPDTGFGGAAMAGAIGAGAAFVGRPINRARNATFGTNQAGQPKFGSAYVGRKFGAIGQFATGGGVVGSRKFIQNPGLGGFGGKAAGAIGKVPVVGPALGGVAKVGGKAAGAIAQAPGVSKLTSALGKINNKVPQPQQTTQKVEIVNPQDITKKTS